MWTHKGKCRLLTKDNGCGIMILAFQSQYFGFGYPLTVPDLQTFNEYCVLHPKYVDTDSGTTIMGHTHKGPITMVINIFFQDFE